MQRIPGCVETSGPLGCTSAEAQTPGLATAHHREILKVGAAVLVMGRLLIVRKKGTPSYILPGGKPEQGENDSQTLVREIQEELGCELNPQSIEFLGSFSDSAADLLNTKVTIRLYAAQLVGDPSPRAEIETIKWYCPNFDSDYSLAPSLRNQIVPFLFKQERFDG